MMKQWAKKVVLMVMAMVVGFLFLQFMPVQKAYAAEVLNVKSFGAKGDGKTDDTTAVTKALSQGATSKTTVYFPAGTYIVNPTNALQVSGGMKVTGDGARSIIKANATFGYELMHVAGKDIEISGLTLDGNKLVNRVLVIEGGSERVTIKNMVVANASHSTNKSSDFYSGVLSGILVYGNTKSITIDNTEVKNIVAVNMVSGSLVARGIYVTTTWGKSETAASNVTITNSYIHDIGPADDGDGIYYEDPNIDNNNGTDTNSVIANNKFENTAKRAIKIYAQGITVKGNTIVNSYLSNNYYKGADKGQLAPDMFSAISIYGSNNTITNNTISGKGSFYGAIEVGASKTVSNITISGNTIIMGSKSVVSGKTAIRLGNISNFTIIGNTIENGERGIWTWQNAEDGTISNNKIEMVNGGGIDLTTYLEQYIQKNITCTANTIQATNFLIQLAPTNVNVVTL
ncbi:glycosyl hydrolase family 28-related protein [Paenibacillus sp. YAF4_2]|uniref:glycosyl hydrolase family 28-related protein n=1 Tax=Paenibacillus sp. YAF4_2 TaxID=3233085 RepID=UPI003F99B461